MSPADVAAIAGAFLAAVITGLGLRRGEAERKSLPAADPSLSAGVFVGLEGETVAALLEELRELRLDLGRWRDEDDREREADKERSADVRFARVEDNQAKILGLLHALDGARSEDGTRRR